jgi:asparagine synthase (glutamine-hydrolysing)
LSGFFGIVRQDGQPVDARLLEKIVGQLDFRGQDGTSIWTQGNVGGCFVFMRTGPARQATQQPVIWQNRYCLWGDLRLDGQRELQESLGDSNGALEPDPTSEGLLLRAWTKWGPDALERVIGDFSFALWDQQESTLWCARDFIGARPLYYSSVNGVFCFSNTLEVLRSVPEVSGELDRAFLGDYLVRGWNTELTRTVYQDIRRVPPSRLLKYSKSGVELRRFRTLPVEELLRFKRAGEYREAYRELLKEAVQDRLPQRATALYLSGGLDSSTVCAVAAQLAGQRGQRSNLKAFTMSWEAFFDDPEPAVAKLTAEYIGIDHEILDEQTLSPFEAAGTADARIPEPGHEVFFARERRKSLRIAAHSSVVLSGDGGDDVLTGQGWPYLLHLLRTRDWKEIAQGYGGYFWNHKRIPPLRGGFRTKLRGVLKRKDPFADYPEWLNPEFDARQNLRQRWLDLENHNPTKEHPFHPGAYEALHDGYWGEVLEAEDAGWNRVKLETRAPLLDLRILTFLLRLPPVPWCVEKELGRQAMKSALPQAVLERPKSPLVRDPVEVCAGQREWIACLPKKAPKCLKEFVNWDKWWETLERSKHLTWRILRPVNLLYWLKAVENDYRIK